MNFIPYIFITIIILIVLCFLNSWGYFNKYWLSKKVINKIVDKFEIDYQVYIEQHEGEIVCYKLLEGEKYTPTFEFKYQVNCLMPNNIIDYFVSDLLNEIEKRNYKLYFYDDYYGGSIGSIKFWVLIKW